MKKYCDLTGTRTQGLGLNYSASTRTSELHRATRSRTMSFHKYPESIPLHALGLPWFETIALNNTWVWQIKQKTEEQIAFLSSDTICTHVKISKRGIVQSTHGISLFVRSMSSIDCC